MLLHTFATSPKQSKNIPKAFNNNSSLKEFGKEQTVYELPVGLHARQIIIDRVSKMQITSTTVSPKALHLSFDDD